MADQGSEGSIVTENGIDMETAGERLFGNTTPSEENSGQEPTAEHVPVNKPEEKDMSAIEKQNQETFDAAVDHWYDQTINTVPEADYDLAAQFVQAEVDDDLKEVLAEGYQHHPAVVKFFVKMAKKYGHR